MEVFNSVNEQLFSQTKPSVLLDKIEFKLNENENNLNDNKQLKQQYIFLKPDPKLQSNQNGILSGTSPNKFNSLNNKSTDEPKRIICSPNAIQLEWKESRSIGAGYMNLGNTCFMNSVLQALTYCPPLVNYLLHSNNDHQSKCKVMALCMICELTKHMRSAFHNSGSVIRPQAILNRLKSLAKHFQPGRQEDSHEFLRYVIDNIWKSCVINWERNHNNIKLDSKSKETTFINQIFGGYHRSQITCLSCKAKSDTYDYFMDFILDIKTVSSLEEALEKFNTPEILRNENAYKCSKCNKKVAAEKRFTVHKAPNVATFQLKRFDYNRIFGGKITKNISYPEIVNLRPYMSESRGEPILYKLFAVLVHLGSTSSSGHYFCYVRNSNNNWYLMDDARVRSTDLNQVLDQQAYMLFYVRIQNKSSINRNDSFKTMPLNHSSLSIINSNNSNNLNGKLIVNQAKPNGLIKQKELDFSTGKRPISINNLPKMINDNVTNSSKRPLLNGESPKLVNNNGFTNRISILSDIDSKVSNNLSKSSSTSLLKCAQSTPKLINNVVIKKPEENKSLAIKRLVPYDDNSSDDDDDSDSKDSETKLKKSNGVKKMKCDDEVEKKCNGSIIKISNNEMNKNSNKELPKIDECKNKKLVQSVAKHQENHIQSNNEKDKKQLIMSQQYN